MRHKVHVLTVSRNIERQEQIKRWWRGWDIQFHHGYDHQDLNCPEPYSRQFALACCWCGHHKIWGKLADEKGWHLIIEDDACPKPGLDQVIPIVQREAIKQDYQIIKLFHTATPPGEERLFDLKENVEFRKGHQGWVSTTAYLIRNTGRAMREVLFATPDLAIHLTTLRIGGIWPLVVDHLGEPTIPPNTR